MTEDQLFAAMRALIEQQTNYFEKRFDSLERAAVDAGKRLVKLEQRNAVTDGEKSKDNDDKEQREEAARIQREKLGTRINIVIGITGLSQVVLWGYIIMQGSH